MLLVPGLKDRPIAMLDSIANEPGFFKVVLETSNEGLLLVDTNSIIRFVNQRLAELLGYTPDELIGTVVYRYIDKKWISSVKANKAQRLSGDFKRSNYRVQVLNKKRQLLWMEISAMAIVDRDNRYQGSLVTLTDINEIYLAERRFRTIFEANPCLMDIKTLDGRFIDVNAAFCNLLGYSKDDFIGQYVTEIPWFVGREEAARLAELIREQGRVRSYEISYFDRSGKKHTGVLNADVLAFSGVPQVVSAMHDITELKEAERERGALQELFVQMFSANPCGILLCDSDKRIVNANQAFEKITGYAKCEVIGHKCVELSLFPDKAAVVELCDQCMTGHAAQTLETTLLTKQGVERHVVISIKIFEWNGRKFYLSSMLDMTETQQMALEITRLDRLNLVGQMAASIGHEIRNPLTTVRGYLQLLTRRPELTDIVSRLELMIEEIDRATNIISEYLGLAKNRLTQPEPICLNEIVRSLFPLIQADIMEAGREIELSLSLLPPIIADSKEIRQVILNLVRNAIEATSYGGRIAIRTFRQDDRLVLAVENNGLPIPAEVKVKLGTPFFTTKDTGTGLGLPVCYSIAARHNAEIKVYSDDTLTSFQVCFPAPEGAAAACPP